MASFHVHLGTSTVLGGLYALAGAGGWKLDWGQALVAAGLTSVGGVIPDFDSRTGIPVRELFGVAGVAVPILLLPRLLEAGFSVEKALIVAAIAYFLVRYGLSAFFKRFTVHRGMFHSIPAMLISGLTVFHLYQNSQQGLRQYMSLGTMIGFLSHLVLDEMHSVDMNGLTPKLNKFAGSALKLFSSSWKANLCCYAVLAALGGAAWWAPGGGTASPLALFRAGSPSDEPVHQVIRPGGASTSAPSASSGPPALPNPLSPRR